jgi:hypothetical protein
MIPTVVVRHLLPSVPGGAELGAGTPPRPIHRWKALVTAELMVISHLNMAYYKGNHLL